MFANSRLTWCSMVKRHAHRDTSWQSLDYLRLIECAAFHWRIGFKIFLCTHYGPLHYFSIYFRKLKKITILRPIPANIYMFKVNNRNTRKRYEIFPKLTIKTLEQRQRRRSGIFIVNFENISHLFLVFLLLTLNK